jgi:hypothetical protein
MFEETMNLFDDQIDATIETLGESSNSNVVISNADEIINSYDKVKCDIDSKNHKLNFNFG